MCCGTKVKEYVGVEGRDVKFQEMRLSFLECLVFKNISFING